MKKKLLLLGITLLLFGSAFAVNIGVSGLVQRMDSNRGIEDATVTAVQEYPDQPGVTTGNTYSDSTGAGGGYYITVPKNYRYRVKATYNGETQTHNTVCTGPLTSSCGGFNFRFVYVEDCDYSPQCTTPSEYEYRCGSSQYMVYQWKKDYQTLCDGGCDNPAWARYLTGDFGCIGGNICQDPDGAGGADAYCGLDCDIECNSANDCNSDGCYGGTYRDYYCSNAGTCSSFCGYTPRVTDNDGDGYDTQCDNDCNDNDNSINPGATEVYDGKDNDCDGQIDEDVLYCGDQICNNGETCSSCAGDCGKCNGVSCSLNSQCQSTHCVHSVCRATNPYCGDGYCDSGENCVADCGSPNGDSCSSNGDCESSHCVHNVCRASDPWCGDGYCDNGESWQTCLTDCEQPPDISVTIDVPKTEVVEKEFLVKDDTGEVTLIVENTGGRAYEVELLIAWPRDQLEETGGLQNDIQEGMIGGQEVDYIKFIDLEGIPAQDSKEYVFKMKGLVKVVSLPNNQFHYRAAAKDGEGNVADESPEEVCAFDQCYCNYGYLLNYRGPEGKCTKIEGYEIKGPGPDFGVDPASVVRADSKLYVVTTINNYGSDLKITNFDVSFNRQATLEETKELGLEVQAATLDSEYNLYDVSVSSSGSVSEFDVEATKVEYYVNGYKFSRDMNEENIVTYSPYDLPEFTGDWYYGDLATHSYYSLATPDDEYPAPIKFNVKQGKEYGLDFIATADYSHHMSMLKIWFIQVTNSWNAVKTECRDSASEVGGIVCIPGLEFEYARPYVVLGDIPTSKVKDWRVVSEDDVYQALIDCAGGDLKACFLNMVERVKDGVLDMNLENTCESLAEATSDSNLFTFVSEPYLVNPEQDWFGTKWGGTSNPGYCDADEFQGFEVMSGYGYQSKALLNDETQQADSYLEFLGENRVNSTGASDAHSIGNIGKARVYVKADGLSESNIMTALKRGSFISTNGPIVDFTVEGQGLGEIVNGFGGQPTLHITWKSTPEFGAVDIVKVFRGTEEVAWIEPAAIGKNGMNDFVDWQDDTEVTQNTYYVIYVSTTSSKRAITNAIWVIAPGCESGSCESEGVHSMTLGPASAEVTHEDPIKIFAEEAQDPQGDTQEVAWGYVDFYTQQLDSEEPAEFDEALIKIYYEEQELEAPEEKHRLYYYDDAWNIVQGGGINLDENFVWGTVDHFTVFAILADTTPPEIEITYPEENGSVWGSEFELEYTVTDDRSGVDTIVFLLNGEEHDGAVFDLTTFTSGEYEITIVATDLVGNENSASVKFEVETPYSLKQQAKALLEENYTKAADAIGKGLEESLWVDEWRLALADGEKAFHADHTALQHLQNDFKCLDKHADKGNGNDNGNNGNGNDKEKENNGKGNNAQVESACDEAAQMLVQANEMILKVIMSEVEGQHDSIEFLEEIKQMNKFYEKAMQETKVEKRVKWLENAWKHARNAKLLIPEPEEPLVKLTEGGESDQMPAWSADGTKIVWDQSVSGVSKKIMSMNADGTSKQKIVDIGFVQGPSHPEFHPDGTKIVFADRVPSGGLYTVNLDGTSKTKIGGSHNSHDGVSWNSDGTKLLYTRQVPDGNWDYNNELFVADYISGVLQNEVRLTNDGEVDAWMDWSPDNTKIVWTSGMNSTWGHPGSGGSDWDIYTMNTDGTGIVRLTETKMSLAPDWSSKGKIVYALFRKVDEGYLSDLWVMNPDGSEKALVYSDGGIILDPQWSPDGTKVAFASNADGDFDIYVLKVTVEEKETEPVTPTENTPAPSNTQDSRGTRSRPAPMFSYTPGEPEEVVEEELVEPVKEEVSVEEVVGEVVEEAVESLVPEAAAAVEVSAGTGLVTAENMVYGGVAAVFGAIGLAVFALQFLLSKPRIKL